MPRTASHSIPFLVRPAGRTYKPSFVRFGAVTGATVPSELIRSRTRAAEYLESLAGAALVLALGMVGLGGRLGMGVPAATAATAGKRDTALASIGRETEGTALIGMPSPPL